MNKQDVDTVHLSDRKSETKTNGSNSKSDAEDRSFSARVDRLISFVKTDVWRIQLSNLSRRRARFIRYTRVLLVAARGFKEDRCALTASGLTYYSLLSIVPLFAMLFGIAKGFGFHLVLQEQLLQRFQGQEAVLTQVFDFSQSLLQNTKGGLVAGIGVFLLFWTVIKLLGNIEEAFNEIWQVDHGRSYVRKFSDYLSIVLVCPLTLIISSSVTIFITTQLSSFTEDGTLSQVIGPLVGFLLRLLPYALLWLVFTFIYMIMPNTKVNFRAALMAGIIAGSVYQLVQWGYVEFQVGVARQNAIYGSFAALPLFLIWLQLSWLIVLLGAEMAFAIQNVDTFERVVDSSKLSLFDNKLVALLITRLIVKRFVDGSRPLTALQIATTLELPADIVHESLRDLDTGGIILRTEPKEEGEVAYSPASDIHAFSVANIVERLEQNGLADLPLKRTPELESLKESLHAFRRTVANSPANKLLKDV